MDMDVAKGRKRTVAATSRQHSIAEARRNFDEAYREFTNTVDLADLEPDPDKIFGGLRDETAGREVQL